MALLGDCSPVSGKLFFGREFRWAWLLTLPLVVKESPWVRDGVRGNNWQPFGAQLNTFDTTFNRVPSLRPPKRAHMTRNQSQGELNMLAAIVEDCVPHRNQRPERRPPRIHLRHYGDLPLTARMWPLWKC